VSMRREKMEVLHVAKKNAIVMTVIYAGDLTSTNDIATLLGDAWHEYAVQNNVDPVRGMEAIHAFKNKN